MRSYVGKPGIEYLLIDMEQDPLYHRGHPIDVTTDDDARTAAKQVAKELGVERYVIQFREDGHWKRNIEI